MGIYVDRRLFSTILFLIFLHAAFAVVIAYKKGIEAGKNQVKQELEIKQKEANQQAQKVLENYLSQKGKEEKQKEQQSENIEKIVTRTVYHNNCFDNDGLRELNAAITRQTAR